MRYVAAYLLAVLGGKENVTSKDVEKILSSVGIEVVADKLALTIKSLEGKNLEELIAAGREKLSALPVGGGAAAPAAASAAPAAAAAEKKEDKKSKSSEYSSFKLPFLIRRMFSLFTEEESDEDSEGDDMGFGLFE